MSSETEAPARLPMMPALALLVVVVVSGIVFIVAFMLRRKTDSLVETASSIQLGQTPAQVTSLLGVPDVSYNSGAHTGVCYGRARTVRFGVQSTARHMINHQFVTDFDDWPLHVRFDSTGVVDRIKCGDTVIEQ